MSRAASSASRTAGTTQAGSTRYFAGSVMWRTAAAAIASATGHQFSPCAAAPSGATGGGAAGVQPEVISHCDLASQAINPCGPTYCPVGDGMHYRTRGAALAVCLLSWPVVKMTTTATPTPMKVKRIRRSSSARLDGGGRCMAMSTAPATAAVQKA